MMILIMLSKLYPIQFFQIILASQTIDFKQIVRKWVHMKRDEKSKPIIKFSYVAIYLLCVKKWRYIRLGFNALLKQCVCSNKIFFIFFMQHHWLASQEGFNFKWQQDMQGNRFFWYSCFYLVTHRRRAFKFGETSSKPLHFWQFFSKSQGICDKIFL